MVGWLDSGKDRPWSAALHDNGSTLYNYGAMEWWLRGAADHGLSIPPHITNGVFTMVSKDARSERVNAYTQSNITNGVKYGDVLVE